MNKLQYALRKLEMAPFDRDGAKVAIVVYHPNSMDEPMVDIQDIHPAQLEANSNRSLVDLIVDHRLLSVISKWRGA